MSAETGVGPSIASGSHTCRGNWADFAMAPVKISSAAIWRVAVCGASAAVLKWKTSASSTNEKLFTMPFWNSVQKSSRIPTVIPKSPMRFVRNAFFPASTAEGFAK